MTKKCFACIYVSKDSMREISRLSSNPANLSRIKNIADQFLKDFGDVDPAWTPGGSRTQAPAKAQPAQTGTTLKRTPPIIQPPAPAKTSPKPDPFAADPNYKPPLF